MNRIVDFSRRRWPALALVASLVLNGFLLGLIATDALRKHSRPGPRVFRIELRHLADRLPRDAVEAVAAELQPLAPALEDRYARLRAARDEIAALAAAPQPDRAAIDERLARLRAETQAMQEEVQRATYDAVLRLPAEQRAALAQPRRR